VSQFRKHLPSGCPPAAAKPPSGETYYRLIKADGVDDRAFLSLTELGQACPPDVNACEWGAISLCTSEAEIDVPRKISPKKFGNAKVSKGVLSPTSGVVLPTPRAKQKSHTSFWPYDEATPWLSFEIVDELSNDA
jgi:hypothetical protein